MPFKMVGRERVDDTPVHKALREALANCLINADYHGVRGVVIRKEADKITFANPGYVRTGKKQMRLGGESDPRKEDLIDDYYITIIPTILGSGIRLFEKANHEIKLRLLKSQSYNGMMDLIYTRR